jgi:hypothetical protein
MAVRAEEIVVLSRSKDVKGVARAEYKCGIKV